MKFAYRGTLVAILLIGALCIVGFVVLESPWFHSYVRQRLVTLIQENTGGDAEFGDYHVDWRRLRVRVQPFILHGTEDASRDPFIRVESAELGLKILSLWKRDIDLTEFRADKPEIHIYVDGDGKTNLPSPQKPSSGKNPVEQFLNLAIGAVDLRDGIFEYDSVRTPFSLKATGLQVRMSYDFTGPKYRGDMGVREVLMDRRYKLGFQGAFVLEGNRLIVESGQIKSGDSVADVRATITDFKRPAIEVSYKAAVHLQDVPLKPPVTGRATLEGVLTYSEAAGYRSRGTARASDLSLSEPSWRIQGAGLFGEYSVSPDHLEVNNATLNAFGGMWHGKVGIRQWRDFDLEGTVDGMHLNELVAILPSQEPLPWDGALSGPIKASGRIEAGGISNVLATAQSKIEPLEGQLPIQGGVDVTYDQSRATLNLGSSYLATEDSRINFRGVLGKHLEVGMRTVDFTELQPVIRLLSGDESFRLPVGLVNGEAVFTGTVDGNLDDPVIRGHVQTRRLELQGHVFDRLEADTTLTKRSVDVSHAVVAQGEARVTGEAHVGLENWRLGENPSIRAAVAMRNVDVATVLTENRFKFPITGRLSASAGIEGTVGAPHAAVRFVLNDASIDDDKFQRLSGRFEYDGGASDRFQGAFGLDQAQLELGGEYRHNGDDWQNGVLSLHGKLERFELASSEKLQAKVPSLTGTMGTEFTGRVDIVNRQVKVRALDGTVSITKVTYRGQPVGDMTLTSATKSGNLTLEGGADLRNTRASLKANVGLTDGYPTEGSINVPRLTFRLISDIAGKDFGAEGPPVRGFLQAKLDFKGLLEDPLKGTAEVVIDETRIRPRNATIGDTQLDSSEFTVRNEGPIRLALTPQGIQVKSAKFVAKETDVTLEGGFNFNSKAPWDTRLKGNINLAVLTTFNPDLVASGNSVINASLRGAADNPEMSGRMEINEGSFFLKDIPNGIDKAHGVILFDRNRATIEKLTGQTGGGTFEVKGFVSLAGDEILYRLQALASQVRVRYPEGVSTTFDADLSLTGSTANSLLTGTVTVQRSGFNPKGDIASIFREPNRPPSAAITENKFLRGMQFDVRVRSAANAFFQSAFTQETQIEADIRLRGSPAKPIVLGSLKANAGEVEFFGNRYTITRGEVLFYNTAVIQPALDIDVETRIRGVTVYININGPLDRVNVTYRSEPPLATNEIVALLTVGRTPGSISGVPQSSPLQHGNIIEQSSNTLLGGALSGALSSRVERFFGVSRVKIDPGVTSLEGTYNSRVTVEQSISKDVTVTFSTNLAKTQQQVISVEWNFSKAWSAVMTRDDNGAFSIEFRLRKQF